MKAVIVNLECLTNMHVGNGDVNFNIIDNEVERDVTTGYPTINSSGVKGALREYFEKNGLGEIEEIFGGDGKNGNTSPGKLRFLNADMLAMPVRASQGNEAYYLVSTEEAVSAYTEKQALFLEMKPEAEKKSVEAGKAVEGFAVKEAVTVLGKDIYLLPEESFRKISLPVLARNKLDNGKSVNLWYEEVVPHKSLFSFAVLAEETDAKVLTSFVEAVNGKIVQFGGNASIGYGLCKVTVTGV